jgi:hypothetical protein
MGVKTRRVDDVAEPKDLGPAVTGRANLDGLKATRNNNAERGGDGF